MDESKSNTQRTQFIYNMFDGMTEYESAAPLMELAIKKTNGADFIRYQRPDPEYYKTILVSSKEERSEYIKSDHGILKADIMRIAQQDVNDILGEDFVCRYKPQPAKRGKKSDEQKRKEELDLCLSIVNLRYDQVYYVLTRFLTSSPLHFRYALDVIYAFVFRSRDKGCTGFETLEEQNEYIARAKKVLDEARIVEKTDDFIYTNVITSAFEYVRPGDMAQFEKWLSDKKRYFDSRNRRYAVRKHLHETLLTLDKSIVWPRKYMELTAMLGTASAYDVVQNGVDRMEKEMSEGKDLEFTEDMDALMKAEFNGMTMVAGEIAVCFQNLWHRLGTEFLMENDHQPADFGTKPNCREWEKYFANKEFPPENEEPCYLADLREYLNKNKNSSYANRAKQLQNEREKFNQLMESESEAFIYIFSDWQYACVAGDREFADSLNMESRDTDTERLRRIVSMPGKIFGKSRTDVQNIPRGLLLLSEITRAQVCEMECTGAWLSKYINGVLTEYGYAPLDVRRKMDFLYYCATYVADDSLNKPLEMGETLEKLWCGIKEATFDKTSLGILKAMESDPYSEPEKQIER